MLQYPARFQKQLNLRFVFLMFPAHPIQCSIKRRFAPRKPRNDALFFIGDMQRQGFRKYRITCAAAASRIWSPEASWLSAKRMASWIKNRIRSWHAMSKSAIVGMVAGMQKEM